MGHCACRSFPPRPLPPMEPAGRTFPPPTAHPPYSKGRPHHTLPRRPALKQKQAQLDIISLFREKILFTSAHYGCEDPHAPSKGQGWVSDGGRHSSERRQGWPGPPLVRPRYGGTSSPSVLLQQWPRDFLACVFCSPRFLVLCRLVYYLSGPIPPSSSTSPLILSLPPHRPSPRSFPYLPPYPLSTDLILIGRMGLSTYS